MLSPSHYSRFSVSSDVCNTLPPPRQLRFSSTKEKNELISENLLYFARIKELEQIIQTEHGERDRLCNKLQKQGETIQKLIEQISQTKQDEFEMTSENLKLKGDLARERKINERVHREINRYEVEKDFSVTWMSEFRENELRERLKEAREILELSREEAVQAATKVLDLEAQRGSLVTKVSSLMEEAKDLRKHAGEGQMLKAVNEELELQLMETRKSLENQLNILEDLRKENFELLRRPLAITMEPESSMENLEKALQLQLRRQIDLLENEKKNLKKKVEEYEIKNLGSIAEERSFINELEINRKKLEDVAHELVLSKCEFEKVSVENQRLKAQLALAEGTLVEETLKWTKRIELAEERMKKAEEQRNSAEHSLKTQGSSKNEIIDKLYQSQTSIEKLTCENRQLNAQIESLTGKIEDEKNDGIRLRIEVEERLKPEIDRLQEQLRTSESSNERLKGDLELKEYLLKEEEAVAKQAKMKLEKAQQRLEESESRVTQSSRLTSDQAERLAKSEAINKQKDSEIQDLKQKVLSRTLTVEQLKSDLVAARSTNDKLTQLNESLESRHLLNGDEHRRLLSDVSFYREELGKLADYHTSTSAGDEKLRAQSLKSVLGGLRRQISDAKDELKLLHMEVAEQIKTLPIESSGESEGFEIVHIVEHFQREKRKVAEELREINLHLSDAECSYQSLLEDHQSLKRAHAQALVDLLDLKQQTNLSLLDNRPKIDVCVETDKENSLVVDENVFIQKKIGTATPPRQNEIDKSCQYLRSLSRNIDESSMSQHPSLQKVFSETSPPNLALRMSDQRVLQRADASDVPTQHRPSLRSQSLHNETQVNMFNHQSQSMRSTFSGSGGNIDLRATPINHDLNAYQNEAAQTPLSSVQQKIALFDKNREPSSGPSLPRPGHSISDSQARTSQNKSNTHSSQAPRDSPSELSSLIFTPLRSEQEIPVQTNSGRQAVIPPVTGESKISQIMKPGKKDDDSKLTGATSTSKPSKPVVQTRSSSRNNRRLIETHKIT